MNRFVLYACLLALCSGAAVPDKKDVIRSSKLLQRSGKVTGGEKTDIEQVPWVLGYEVNNKLVCHATIISEKIAVTDTKCILKYDVESVNITLRAGSSLREEGGTVHKVVKFNFNNNFELQGGDYNIALLEVEEPFVWGPGTQPVKLNNIEPAANDKVTVAGWGALDWYGLEFPDDLYSVEIRVVSKDDCIEGYKGIVNITDRMLCASDESNGACFGDNGAPLVQNGTLVGIAFGDALCGFLSRSMPGLYTNTANQEIYDFITKNSAIKH